MAGAYGVEVVTRVGLARCPLVKILHVKVLVFIGVRIARKLIQLLALLGQALSLSALAAYVPLLLLIGLLLGSQVVVGVFDPLGALQRMIVWRCLLAAICVA